LLIIHNKILKDNEHEISLAAVEFVSNILIYDPNKRLRSKNIKNHLFFNNFDWNKLESGDMEPAINFES
jgi:hypothetical protein